MKQDAIEAARLAKLQSFRILDTPDEREFNVITWLARSLLDCPTVAISLIDEHRQWFKAKQGIDADETPRSEAFCSHAVQYDDIMIVEDATKDPRFVDYPAVTAEDGLRFYAGVPLRPSSPGHSDDLPGIGTLCVADSKPRSMTAEQVEVLQDLATMVSALIRARADADTALDLAKLAQDRAREIDRKHSQLRQAERIAGLGSWRLHLSDGRFEWSDQVFAIHGLSVEPEAPTLQEALRFYNEADKRRVMRNVERARSKGAPFDFECDFIRADGEIRRVRSMGECEWLDGKPDAIVGVMHDVTDSYNREEMLRRSAYTDSLTGLPNRAALERELDRNIAAARRDKAPLSLLIFDLDGFKAVNDSFGHDAGDEVLQVMADRLRGQNYSYAFAARLGGDEFVMLVSRPRDCAELESFIAGLLGELIYTVERDGQTRSVSATIGAARFDPSIASGGELMRSADLALYEAKRAQRGTARIFGTDVTVLPDWRLSDFARNAPLSKGAETDTSH